MVRGSASTQCYKFTIRFLLGLFGLELTSKGGTTEVVLFANWEVSAQKNNCHLIVSLLVFCWLNCCSAAQSIFLLSQQYSVRLVETTFLFCRLIRRSTEFSNC